MVKTTLKRFQVVLKQRQNQGSRSGPKRVNKLFFLENEKVVGTAIFWFFKKKTCRREIFRRYKVNNFTYALWTWTNAVLIGSVIPSTHAEIIEKIHSQCVKWGWFTFRLTRVDWLYVFCVDLQVCYCFNCKLRNQLANLAKQTHFKTLNYSDDFFHSK